MPAKDGYEKGAADGAKSPHMAKGTRHEAIRAGAPAISSVGAFDGITKADIIDALREWRQTAPEWARDILMAEPGEG